MGAGRRHVAHPAFWIRRHDGAVVLARDVRADSAAAGLAGLRQPGGSVRLRALEGAPAADRSGVPPRRLRDPVGTERVYPWGDAPPDPTRGNFDFALWEPVPVGSRPGRRQRVGRPRSGRQRMGVDVDGLRSVRRVLRRWRRIPEYSADFFDGQHYVMKGARRRRRSELRAPQLPQLVPRRTIRTSTRSSGPRASEDRWPRIDDRDHVTLARHDTSIVDRLDSLDQPSPPTCGAISRWRRSSCSRSISTTRSARACSRRSAGCRGTASRARSARCSTRTRRRSSTALGEDEPRHDRRARMRQRREARRSSPRRCRRPAARARVHLIDISSQALEQSERTLGAPAALLGRRPPRHLRGRAAPRRRGARRRRSDARPAARLEHRQLRSAGGARVPARASALRSRPATRCCSAPISSSRSATCSSPTTIRSA